LSDPRFYFFSSNNAFIITDVPQINEASLLAFPLFFLVSLSFCIVRI